MADIAFTSRWSGTWSLSFLLLAGCGPATRPVATLPSAEAITVAAAGDLSLGGRWKDDPLASLGEILDGDLRVLNLEGPLTDRGAESGLDEAGRPDGQPVRFRSPPARAAWLARRVDVVSLANNHALDQGEGGRSDTVDALSHHAVEAAFPGHDVVLSRRGRRVTVVARYFPPEADLDGETETIAAVAHARSTGPVLVSLHWGHTGSLLPTPAQRRFAARLVEAGAAAVLGHGPHSLQGIERRGRSVIAYSLGNLAFGCRCTDETDAYALRFTLDGEGAVTAVRAVPLEAGLLAPPRPSDDPGLRDLIDGLSSDLERPDPS